MNSLLMKHGEKLFLAVVIVLSGVLLLGAVSNLGQSTSLGSQEKKNLELVQAAVEGNTPDPLKPLMLDEHLAATFKGRSEPYSVAISRISSPTPDPKFYKAVDPPSVESSLGRISGLNAAGDRGRVTVTWKRPNATELDVVKYEIFRDQSDQPYATLEPSDVGAGEYSYDDRRVEAEKSYTYWVRPLARKAKSDKKVQDPPDTEKVGDLFAGAKAGPAKASVPSNIVFECTGIFDDFGKKRAIIFIKRWNNESNGWDVFDTRPGIAKGEPIVGKRRVGPTQVETFDSGYVVVEIFDGVKTIIEERMRSVEDPPGSGNVVKKMVKVEVPVRMQYFVGRKGDTEIKVDVKKRGSSTGTGGDTGRDTGGGNDTGGGSLLDQIKNQMQNN